MKIVLIILLFTTISIFGSEYITMNGKKTEYKRTEFYLALKSNKIKTFKEIKNEFSKIAQIEDIIFISKNSFVIKFKNKFNYKDIKEYKIMPTYSRNNGWPIIINNKIIIKFKKSVSQKDKDLIFKNFNLKNIYNFNFGAKILEVKEDAFEISNKLFKTGLFEYSYPDYYKLHEKYFKPNDPGYINQWQFSGVQGAKTIEAEKAWNITKGSSDIKIAIIDDGMDIDHEDLNVVASKDITGDNSFALSGNPDHYFDEGMTIPDESAYHGTFVAGVAAAQGDNNKGVTGICMNCSLIAANVLSYGSGDLEYSYLVISVAAKAFEWVTKEGADVINNSWGYYGDSGGQENLKDINPVLYDAIHDSATNGRNGKGTIIVFATGNASEEILDGCLCDHPDAMAVSATDYKDKLTDFTNYGNPVSVVAPGQDMTSTDIMGAIGYDLEDYTSGLKGTSFSAPLVSGLAGLILSQNPNLTSKEVIGIIEKTADKITDDRCPVKGYNSDGHSKCMGYGRINAYKALKYVVDGGNGTDPCENISCDNHGNCKIENSNAICSCNSGYHPDGLHCVENSVDNPCEGVSCSNHGSCKIKDNKAYCECEVGYEDSSLNCIKKSSGKKDDKKNEEESGCSYSNHSANSLFLIIFFLMFVFKKRKKIL